MSCPDSPSIPSRRHDPCHSVALCLAGALVLSPILLACRLDWDRALPLLLLPALLISWRNRHPIVAPAHKIQAYALVAAVVAWIVSTAFSAQYARAAATGSAWVLIVAGGIVARRMAGQPSAMRIVLSGMLFSSLLGFVVVQLFISPSAGIPLYGHPRLLGLHLLIGSLAAIGLFITQQTRSRLLVVTSFLLATVITGGMWWSGGRTPLVGLAAGLIAWFWIASGETRRRMLCRVPLILVGALLVALPLRSPVAGVGVDSSIERTIDAKSLNALSSNRTSFWEVVCTHIQTSPWIGHGADAYQFILPKQDGAQPHNFLLQWMLDFGLLGAIPLSLLLMLRLHDGLGKTSPPDAILQVPAAGLVACVVAGLLDGMFYHAILFMPVAILAGLIPSPRITAPAHTKLLAWCGRLTATIATLVLFLNGWLFLRLHLPPPQSPQTLPAQLLRIFPSNVHGLWTWLDDWKTRDPDGALEWAHWAGRHATSPELFGIYAARLELERKHYEQAEAELLPILSYIDAPRRHAIEGMINTVRRSAAQAGHPLTIKTTAPERLQN